MSDKHSQHKSKYTADRMIPGAFEGETVTRRRFMTGTAHTAGGIAAAAFALPVMKRRRVTVSPSKAPGIIRSAVYLDLCWECLSDTDREQYRGAIQGVPGVAGALVRIASIAAGAPAATSSFARRCCSLEPHPTARAPAVRSHPPARRQRPLGRGR